MLNSYCKGASVCYRNRWVSVKELDRDTPWTETPPPHPWRETSTRPLDRGPHHIPGQKPPDKDPPGQRPLDRDPWTETPPGQRPPDRQTEVTDRHL